MGAFRERSGSPKGSFREQFREPFQELSRAKSAKYHPKRHSQINDTKNMECLCQKGPTYCKNERGNEGFSEILSATWFCTNHRLTIVKL